MDIDLLIYAPKRSFSTLHWKFEFILKKILTINWENVDWKN